MTMGDRIKVMQGYLDGKQIEVKELNEESWRLYVDGSEPRWNWLERDYRIKPTPKYRPLKSEELHELKGKWLKHKQYEIYELVTKIDLVYSRVHTSGTTRGIMELFTGWTHEDGTPVGKLEE